MIIDLTLPDSIKRVWTGITRALLSITEPDPRSLTAFRIVLAFGVLLDLWQRFTSSPYFYSEDGLLPHALWEQLYGDMAYYWTVHFLGGSAWLLQGVLLAQMGLALVLLLGYRTRWVSGLSWVLLLSLVLRNPLLFYGGDKLAPILLLIGAFLPLSSWLQRTSLTSGVSRLASFWLLVQMAVLYIASGQSKLVSANWQDGSALHNVLEMNMLVRPLGTWFGQFDVLLEPLSFITPWAEIILPFLFFVPLWHGRVRVMAILGLFMLNMGIQSMLDVGFFMFYASAGLLGLLPAQFWDDLTRFRRTLVSWLGFRLRLGDGLGGVFGAEPLPLFLSSDSRSGSALKDVLSGVASLVMIAFIAVTLATGLEGMKLINMSYPPPSWTVIRGLNIYQNWGLFTLPTPAASWYVSKAKLADGSWVDILQAGRPVVWAHQRTPNALYRSNSKWRVAMANIGLLAEEDGVLERTGHTLAQHWNDEQPPQRAIEALTIYSLSQPLPIEGDAGRTWRIWLEWPSPKVGSGD